MIDPRYEASKALDPFFAIVLEGLSGLVDGDHYYDTLADNAVFEYRYVIPGWPRTVIGRDSLITLYAEYHNNMVLHSADALVVIRGRDPRIVILEYDVHGRATVTGNRYDNRFISVVTIENRKIVRWRDYMDSYAAMATLGG